MFIRRYSLIYFALFYLFMKQCVWGRALSCHIHKEEFCDAEGFSIVPTADLSHSEFQEATCECAPSSRPLAGRCPRRRRALRGAAGVGWRQRWRIRAAAGSAAARAPAPAGPPLSAAAASGGRRRAWRRRSCWRAARSRSRSRSRSLSSRRPTRSRGAGPTTRPDTGSGRGPNRSARRWRRCRARGPAPTRRPSADSDRWAVRCVSASRRARDSPAAAAGPWRTVCASRLQQDDTHTHLKRVSHILCSLYSIFYNIQRYIKLIEQRTNHIKIAEAWVYSKRAQSSALQR